MPFYCQSRGYDPVTESLHGQFNEVWFNRRCWLMFHLAFRNSNSEIHEILGLAFWHFEIQIPDTSLTSQWPSNCHFYRYDTWREWLMSKIAWYTYNGQGWLIFQSAYQNVMNFMHEFQYWHFDILTFHEILGISMCCLSSLITCLSKLLYIPWTSATT